MVIYLIALSTANMAYAMSNDSLGNGVNDDAKSALQETRSLIFAGLEKNMQASRCALPAQRREIFGIDDIDSYAQKPEAAPVLISVEG